MWHTHSPCLLIMCSPVGQREIRNYVRLPELLHILLSHLVLTALQEVIHRGVKWGSGWPHSKSMADAGSVSDNPPSQLLHPPRHPPASDASSIRVLQGNACQSAARTHLQPQSRTRPFQLHDTRFTFPAAARPSVVCLLPVSALLLGPPDFLTHLPIATTPPTPSPALRSNLSPGSGLHLKNTTLTPRVEFDSTAHHRWLDFSPGDFLLQGVSGCTPFWLDSQKIHFLGVLAHAALLWLSCQANSLDRALALKATEAGTSATQEAEAQKSSCWV